MTKLERKLTNELKELKEQIKLTRGQDKSMTVRKYELINKLNEIRLQYHITRSDKGHKRDTKNDDFDFGSFDMF